MKMFLPVAVLLACATAVEAQEPVRTLPVEPTPVEAPAPEATPTADAPVTTAEAPVTVEASAEAPTEAPADAPAIVQDTPRGWWWTVGAIVLAGVILALVL